ncbi:MAG: ThuA domain-containing protein [Planctomycetia bacterium]|nr:ThuA domain-containing protein [Planctomycetia bacterium]
MKRRDFIELLGTCAVVCAAPGMTWADAGEKRGKILYFDLSTEWEHPPTVDEADGLSYAAKKIQAWAKPLGLDVVCSKDGSLFDGDLSQYAAFVFYTCGELDKAPEGKIGISEQGVKNLFAAIRGGTGLLGIHSATDTWQCQGELFENQPESERTEYIRMIGGDFITHGDQQETTLIPTQPVELPCLKKRAGAPIRHFEEWYCLKNLNPDMHVILVQETAGMNTDGHNACYKRPSYPSTWARMEGQGRVAYTSLGHGNEMWDKELVQDVITDLVAFVAGQIDLDLTPNLEKVCPGANVLMEK